MYRKNLSFLANNHLAVFVTLCLMFSGLLSGCYTNGTSPPPTTLLSLTPDSGSVSTAPSQVVATFSGTIYPLLQNALLIGGNCTTLPIISTVVLGVDSKSATATLFGGVCTQGQSLTVTLNPKLIIDTNGASVTGPIVTNTYTIVTGKIIFSTLATFHGNLGGISGADAACTTDDNKPNNSTYKALLVDGSLRVACTSDDCGIGGITEHQDWVLAPNTQYVRVDGSTVIGTTDANGIFPFDDSYTFTNPINAQSGAIWTGLNTDWTSGETCNTWIDSTTSFTGSYGFQNSTGTGVIWFNSPLICSSLFQLYCVEQ